MNTLTPSDVHSKISSIWNDILGFNIEDDTENFFALGGSSMQAFEITARVNETFKLDLTIMDFFENLSIRNQVDLLINRHTAIDTPCHA